MRVITADMTLRNRRTPLQKMADLAAAAALLAFIVGLVIGLWIGVKWI